MLIRCCHSADDDEAEESGEAEAEGSGSGSEAEAEEDEDVEMNGDDQATDPKKPFDPSDLSAFNLDKYDEEESKGTGKFSYETRHADPISYGRLRQRQGTRFLSGQQ